VEKWVEPLEPDSSPQRANQTTGIGTVGCNERSELHRLFGLGGKAREGMAEKREAITRTSEYAPLFEPTGLLHLTAPSSGIYNDA